MSLLQSAPALTAADAARLAREQYGLRGTAEPLPSERDQNFVIHAGSQRFVLKIANRTEQRTLLEAQNAVLAHLATRVSFCPRVASSLEAEQICEGPSGHLVRLVTWLPGVPLGTLRQQPAALLADLGRCLGSLDRALADFDHPALHRQFHWDLAGAPEIVARSLPAVPDLELRRAISRDLDRLITRLLPRSPMLRQSIVHNDANDYNVLVSAASPDEMRVSGLIDFGDMLYSYTIADLAVAAAYAALDKPDPIAAVVPIVREYHAQYPLVDDEIHVVFDLMKLRLYLSIVHAMDQQSQRPGDAYLAISQAAIHRTLPTLWMVDSEAAEEAFRNVCNA